MENKWTNTKS